MGSDEPYCYIEGKPYTSEKLSSLLLRHLKEDAEAALGEQIKDAVITVPAYFYSREREATIRAAQAAGLKVKKIIDEPNAAAMAYGLNNWRENANILVYDLGGGTFDVTLVHMGKNGDLSTITTRGNHKLGGRDWDDRIDEILFDRFEEETGIDYRGDADAAAMIRGASEGLKKQLSAMMSAKVTLSFPDYGRASVTVSRQDFEESTLDLLDRTGALCQAVLEEADLTIRQITDVLLVGGSTRMPQVSAYLQKMFGKKPLTHVNPDEAVALGAAIQSSKQSDEYTALSVQVVGGKKVTDRSSSGLGKYVAVKPAQKLTSLSVLNLRETTAHAMGIIAKNEDGTKYINDIIIPANHPRPVKSAKAYYIPTKAGTENKMEIFVLQGDKEEPLENTVAFRYVVSGIRHIPRQRDTMIRVQYSYDENGIIRVSARQEEDTTNLPIKRETVPSDMSEFAKSIDMVSTTSKSSSTSLGVYSKWAGISNIPATARDRFGNPYGDEYDLAPDGSFDGQGIYILNLCNETNMEYAMEALKKKGFHVFHIRSPLPADEFRQELRNYCQLWVISHRIPYLTEEHYEVIREFFDKGNGLYIWGDNDPYIADANFLISRLFSSNLSGDYIGRNVLSIQKSPGMPGIIEDHLISTGLVSFFEGATIAQVKISGGLEPLIYSSDSNVVTAFYDMDGKRALIDGAFTRLHNELWGESAGTERYIVNAAVWLANIEQRHSTYEKATVDEETIEIKTWED